MPKDYTVGDILRAAEGSLAPVACLEDEENQCERSSICATLKSWTSLDKAINDYVDSVTLQDLLEEYVIDDKINGLEKVATKKEKKNIDKFLALQKDKEDLWAKTEFCNDIVFRVSAIAEAANHSDAGGTSYMYYFAKESDEENMGACHASEVAYVFHNLTGAGFSGTMDEKLADEMCAMWANFARTGDPSIEEVEWTPYNSDTRETLVFGNDGSLKMESDPLSEQRKLIEPLLKYYVK